MYLIILGVLCICSPLIGFLLYKSKFGFSQVAAGSALLLPVVYFILKQSGLYIVGEEGDYNLYALSFLFINIIFFQGLRIRNVKLKSLLLLPGAFFILWCLMLVIFATVSYAAYFAGIVH